MPPEFSLIHTINRALNALNQGVLKVTSVFCNPDEATRGSLIAYWVKDMIRIDIKYFREGD